MSAEHKAANESAEKRKRMDQLYRECPLRGFAILPGHESIVARRIGIKTRQLVTLREIAHA